MKQCWHQHRVPDLERTFPGRIAGASLKQLLPVLGVGPPLPPFPGRIAGASLKRGDLRSGRSVQTSFPRQNRRGLIEASSPATTAPCSSSTFPGRTAGASLKLLCPPRIAVFERLFPRQNRRGLIEAAHYRAYVRANSIFPRQNRRGLIEALLKRRLTMRSQSLSPAESPGPH